MSVSSPPSYDWQRGIGRDEAAAALEAALAQGRVGTRSALILHDLDALSGRIRHLRECFPPRTLHALAIKANPVVALLRHAVECGMGLEAASLEEVALARAAGAPPDRIVYDSPAKTREEIAFALSAGILLNADNLRELERIDEAIGPGGAVRSLVGLRVNPQVGTGRIGMLSVSGRYSKFGVPLGERRSEIVEAYVRFPWLRALHLHVGSQGISQEQLTSAVHAAFELREEIHAALGEPRLESVDIGGGLPWRYRDDESVPTPASYAGALRQAVPQAFSPDVRLITEFGRAIQTGCGFAASRVEYLKQDCGKRTAVVHFGADLLMRRVYRPTEWNHRISVLTPDATPKQAPEEPHTIAGPLCFAGDILAEDLLLPRVEEGDWIVIHDVGGYTLGLWSRHCNRGLPLVLGYSANPWRFRVLLEGEKPEDVVRFWGG
jgi:diaminopimelate decarboxylase